MHRLFPLWMLLALVSAPLAHAQESARLETGKRLDRDLTTGERHVYELSLEADQFVSGEAGQESIDLVVTIYDPDEKVIAAFDGPARGPEPFQFESGKAGRYRVEITPFRDDETGRYSIVLWRAEPVAATPEARVGQLMATYDREDSPGGAVVVVRGGEVIFAQGYGMANLEYDVPITPETVFHVASVSKQFTAYAIVLLAQQGKLSLDDDIRTHLPDMPAFDAPITIRHLVHHTSGLRDQWSLWALSGGRMDDVITQDNLLSLVYRQRELNFAPGAEHAYSNTGYMLMAEIVEQVTGETFRDWMRANVFEPLGMRDTQVYDDHERIVKGRAYSYGYGPDGSPRKAVLSYANAGATSLFTTGLDLAKWLNNFRGAPLGGQEAVAQMQQRGVLTGGDTLRYAFGLVIDEHRGLKRIQHGGADAGYRTFVAYYPEIDAGLVVLSNLGSFNFGIADRVAEAFFEARMAPEEGPEAPHEEQVVPEGVVAFAPDRFDDYAGKYEMEGGAVITYTREADRYFAQVAGQPRLEIFPLSDSTFTYTVVDARVTFRRGPDGGVQRATHHQGRDVALRRLMPYEPTADALQAFTGRYYSPELETAYTLEVEDGRLVAKHRRHGTIALTPKEENAFSGGAWFFGNVVFERDGAGRITGMRVSEGRVRNLLFERQ